MREKLTTGSGKNKNDFKNNVSFCVIGTAFAFNIPLVNWFGDNFVMLLLYRSTKKRFFCIIPSLFVTEVSKSSELLTITFWSITIGLLIM